MSEQNKNSQKDPAIEKRPVASPEQVRAFRTAYAMLTKKAVENGERVMFGLGADGNERMYMFEPPKGKDLIPNAVGGSALIETPVGETYGWVYAYDEDYAHQSGKLGSFTETITEDGIEQYIYEFYPDSNVQKLHFVHGYGEDGLDETTPMGWLDSDETEQLTLTIEDAHFEYRKEPTS